MSHKLTRWIGPFLLVAIFLANLSLIFQSGYRWLFYLQAVGYSLSLIGLVTPFRGPLSRIARLATSFVVMNAALLTGFLRWVGNPHNVVWKPTVRQVIGQIPSLGRETR